MKNYIVALTVVSFVLMGKAYGQFCTTDARYTEVQYFDSTELTISANLQYGIAQDFQGNPDTLLMDLYYPKLTVDTSAKRPFVLLFHGGGFSSGDKQLGDIRDLCVHLALRGFVCASANYRLGYDFSEYGQYKARYRAIQDGHAAMRYIVSNANSVRVDTNWLFVGGQSAGSLLALGMVYADESELDSIALLYGPTPVTVELGDLHTSGNNLTDTYAIQGIFNNWGGVVESEVDPDEMLPTVAFHGGMDSTVLIDADPSFAHYTLNGSRAIHQDLLSHNVCSELTVDTMGGHGIYRNASTKFRAQRGACFFKSVFCNNCTDFYSTDSIPSTCSLPPNGSAQPLGSRFVVHPNPFTTSFKVAGMDGGLDLALYNAFGQLVHAAQGSNGEVALDLMPGVYFLIIRDRESQASFTTKLIRN